VGPRRASRAAAGQHAEVTARCGLEPDLLGVLQHVDEPPHRPLGRDAVADPGHDEHRRLDLAQGDPPAAEVDLAVRQAVRAEEPVVHLAERAAGVGDHVVGEAVHRLDLREEVAVVQVRQDGVGLGDHLVDRRELEDALDQCPRRAAQRAAAGG
jgi:hypothetical protein